MRMPGREALIMTGATLGVSKEAIRWALRDAPGVPPQCVSVLVGLAEHADKHGRGSFPSAATLAVYTRKSERQVRYDLLLLAGEKLIRAGDQTLARKLPHNRRPVVYDLAMERVRDLPGVQLTSPLEDEGTEPGVQPAAPRQPTAPQESADLGERGRGATDFTPPDESQGCNAAQPGVQPTADKPPINLKSKPSSRRKRDLNEGREDVDRLCVYLADRVERNGSLRPNIGKKWRDAARLMLDNDHRTEDQVRRCIDWCQSNEFWRKNVMSMPKLRAQYDRLRMDADDERRRMRNQNGGQGDPRSAADQRWAQRDVIAAELRAEREGRGQQPPDAIPGSVIK